MAGHTDPGVVWFRRDLRLTDNPAWAEATRRHERVVPLFVIDPALFRPGTRRSSQLLHELRTFDRSLSDHGGRLHVRVGDPRVEVPAAIEALGAGSIGWNADVSPYATRRDSAVRRAVGVPTTTSWGTLVHPPAAIRTRAGAPYRVFTPFHARWSSTPWSPHPSAREVGIADDPGAGLPEPTGIPAVEPGERAALERLHAYADRASTYDDTRDRPDLDATSRLSIDLKVGTLDPRRAVITVGGQAPGFVRQLAWRDFHAHVLHANPHAVDSPLDPRYRAMAWRSDEAAFDAWRSGHTGYPIVDAGMRQLAAEGWMHGRVRMITASFLVKDLLIDWRRGERWFRTMLLDGDTAQNVGNWQWVAGTGLDAAPWFRVFNPTLQGKRFDPDGSYVRRWVPELRRLDATRIHEPWTAAAGDSDPYPPPIVDHAAARDEAIATYSAARSG